MEEESRRSFYILEPFLFFSISHQSIQVDRTIHGSSALDNQNRGFSPGNFEPSFLVFQCRWETELTRRKCGAHSQKVEGKVDFKETAKEEI